MDHKRLGIMDVGAGLVFFAIAGLMAAVMRWQLALSERDAVSAEVFNRLFTMLGTSMVFLVGIPIVFGFANYLVPLMIGARDLAFPRLNAFGFWVFQFGGLLLYGSYLGGEGLYGAGSAPAVGWFAYSPLTGRARPGLVTALARSQAACARAARPGSPWRRRSGRADRLRRRLGLEDVEIPAAGRASGRPRR